MTNANVLLLLLLPFLLLLAWIGWQVRRVAQELSRISQEMARHRQHNSTRRFLRNPESIREHADRAL